MISSGPVEDRLAIRELVESYNDAVMRFDGDAWQANWRDDATWCLPGAGDITGKANFFPVWQGAMAGFSFVGFFASAGPIVVDGDTAPRHLVPAGGAARQGRRQTLRGRPLRGRLRQGGWPLVLPKARVRHPEVRGKLTRARGSGLFEFRIRGTRIGVWDCQLTQQVWAATGRAT